MSDQDWGAVVLIVTAAVCLCVLIKVVEWIYTGGRK